MKTFSGFVATLIVGGLFGAAITLSIVGHDLDLLYYQIKQLQLQYLQLDRENQQLVEDIKKHTDATIPKIRKLDIHITTNNPDDESLKIQLTKYVQEQLQFLIGRPLSAIRSQPDTINRMLDHRVVKYDNNIKSYKIHVDSVVLDETIHIWIHLESL
jgi:hypothetical protein